MTIHINAAYDEFLSSVGFGKIDGHRRVAALGNNPDVDTATVPEVVWSGGGLYSFMTGATSLEMVSTSAADSAAGTGARSVLWNLLDTDYVETPVTLSTNGLTPVPVPAGSHFRVNPSLIMGAGSGETNAGDLILRDAGGGTVRAIIPAGSGITRQAVYTVPAGFTLNIGSQLLSINRSGGVTRYATCANFVRSSAGFYRIPLEISFSERQPYRHEQPGWLGIFINEKSDYAIRCTAVTNDNTDITAAFVGFLRSNTVP